jgi:hypothetical protein
MLRGDNVVVVMGSMDDFFRRIVKRMFKDIENMEKSFGISEFREGREDIVRRVSREPRRIESTGGFSISISSNGVGPPKMVVHRLGPKGWERVPTEKAGVPVAIGRARGVVAPPERRAVRREYPKIEKKLVAEYDLSVTLDEVTVTVKAPNVESEDNVKIQWFPDSIEVACVSPKDKKEYFAAVNVPHSASEEGAKVEVNRDNVVIRIPRRKAY